MLTERGVADCPICLGPFEDPISCDICKTTFCRQCMCEVAGVRCTRCKGRNFSRSTLRQLAQQYTVNCERCPWSGHIADAATHHCRGTSPARRASTAQTKAAIDALWEGVRSEAILAASPKLSSARVQIIALVHQLRQNNTDAAAWFHLAETLSNSQETVEINRAIVNRVDCYKMALHLSPRNVDAWIGLGASLAPGELVEVHGSLHSRRNCFEKALRVDDWQAHAWYLLACELRKREVIRLYEVGHVQGLPEEVSAFDCLRRALTIDPRHAPSFAQLAMLLEKDEAIPINGDLLTAAKACRLALSLDPDLTQAWEAAAELTEPGEPFVMHDGTRIERAEALRRAGLRTVPWSPQRSH